MQLGSGLKANMSNLKNIVAPKLANNATEGLSQNIVLQFVVISEAKQYFNA